MTCSAMRPGRGGRLCAVGLAVGVVMWFGFSAVASGQSGRSSRPPEDEDLAARVNTKLEEVLETQQEVLKRLDEISEELKIIKIRATLR